MIIKDINVIQQAIHVDDENMCIVCYEKKADCIVSPCGHVATCCSCMKNWLDTKQTCPVCRKEISEYKKINSEFYLFS